MEDRRTRLPRVSTMAYKELRPMQPANGGNAAQPPLAEEACVQALADLATVNTTVQKAVKQSSLPAELGTSLSALMSAIEARASAEAVAAALNSVRVTCGQNIKMLFDSGNTQHANATTAMLDTINKICRPLRVTNYDAAANGNGNGAAVASSDDSEFFSPPEALNDILTISVDPNLLVSRPIEEPATNGRRGPRAAGENSGPGRGGGRGRGRGRGGNQSIGEKRRYMAPKVWTHEIQNQFATAIHMVLQPDAPIKFEPSTAPVAVPQPPPNPNEPVVTDAASPESLHPLLVAFVEELSNSGASAAMRSMGATLPRVISTLQAGKFLEPEEMLGSIGEEAHSTAENYLTTQNPDIRRGKIIGQADSFCNLVGELMDRIIGELLRIAKAKRMRMPESELLAEELAERAIYDAENAAAVAAAAAANAIEVQRLVRVPLCIQANREPYRHGEWRKTPFVPRPYTRLQEYFIVEEATRETIERKLSTKKRGGCGGQHCGERERLGTYSLEAETFITECSCLSRNTECDDTCGCVPQGPNACLNRAVTTRQTVKIDEDVEEINSWGMDCYTRRNIQDAILESQAFGAYEMPNYRYILQQIKAGVPPARIAATAAGQHAAVAADSPAPGTLVEGAGAGGSGSGSGDGVSNGSGGAGAAAAASGAAAGSSPTATTPGAPKSKAAVERAAVEWIERTLVPAINRQGPNGWDLRAGLADVKARAIATNDTASLAAADAVEARLELVGSNYFRIHPKGVGLVCRRPGGLPRLTFVEEYLGEIHTPHRWFELQDAVKKITGDELPDFYNITLERPRDDPDGYDILFVDAAAKGAFASRMSHSCTPNCQAVVMACGGRLTIALYTLRHVYEGEELTFDYSSVTESEKEFRDAICLCGTHMCRGSYLYFTGSRAFMQVMTQKHNMLHRNAILCRAGIEPVTQADKERLKKYGIGESCLGSVARGDRVEPWLEKWAALICEYLELEEACLKDELLNRDPFKSYTEATAAAEAKGVVANRVQNIAITLDKVRMFLSQPGQPKEPVLRPLTDEGIINHIWRGPKSIAKKLLRGTIGVLGGTANQMRSLTVAADDEMMEVVITQMKASLSSSAQKLCEICFKEARTVAEARKHLQAFVDQLRVIDVEKGGGLTAAADVGQMYVLTQHWVTSGSNFKSFMSNPVPINLQDLFLNREAAAAGTATAAAPAGDASGSAADAVAKVEEDAGNAVAAVPEGGADALATSAAAAIDAANAAAAAPPPVRTPEEEEAALAAAARHANALAPSLSAERRGTLSLPDIESCFAGSTNRGYGPKQRYDVLDHIESRPDGMWKTGTQWAFRNEAKIYGSPMLDAAWGEQTGEGNASWRELIEKLKSAAIPFEMPKGPVRSSGGGRGRRGGGAGGGGRGRGNGGATGGATITSGAGTGRPVGRPRGSSRRAAAVAAEEAGFGLLDEDMLLM